MNRFEERQGDFARAAVLVPVCTDGAVIRVILTERTKTLTRHAGQVAFPGGRFDPGRDDGLVATALRETFEEIGLSAASVEVTGALPERRTLSSNYVVSPFVGHVRGPCRLSPDGREVGRVFEAPLDLFTEPLQRGRFVWRHEGHEYMVPFVQVGESRVWGVTLEIIDDLLEALSRDAP